MGEAHEEDEGGGELPGAFELGWAGQLKLTRISPFDGQVTTFPKFQEVKAAAVAQVVDKDFEDRFPNAGMLPAMETLITDLPRRGLRGDIVPGLESGELPENILEDEAVIKGWATTGGGRKQWLDKKPLGVGEESSSWH